MQALDSGRKMYCETLRAAATLFQQADMLGELPPTLCKTYEVRSRELEAAYEDSIMSANEAFWGRAGAHRDLGVARRLQAVRPAPL